MRTLIKYIAGVVFLAVLSAQAMAQTISLDKCLFAGNTNNSIQSGADFTYDVKISLSAGTYNDLTIVDPLPEYVGVSSGMPTTGPSLNSVGSTITTTGGTYYDGYFYGRKLTLKFNAPVIVSGSGGANCVWQIPARAMPGKSYACGQMNGAYAFASNITCTPSGATQPVPKRSYSDAVLIDIKSANDWKINKVRVGYVGVNTIRYKIIVERTNPYTKIGYYNLINPIVDETLPTGAVLSLAGNAIGSISPSIISTNPYKIQLGSQLDVIQYSYNAPWSFMVDVYYPCNLFPAGTPVQNCVRLTGQSPDDCNRVSSNNGACQGMVYTEPWITNATCEYANTTSNNCVRNWSPNISTPPSSYQHACTDAEYVTYPLTGTVCTKDTIPNAYNARTGFVKYDSQFRNHAPGCQGYFTIEIRNNGNVPMVVSSLTDSWPGTQLNLDNISAPSGVTYAKTPNTANPTSIQFTFTAAASTLYPGEIRYIYLYYTIPGGASVGSWVKNCSTIRCNGTLAQGGPACPQPPVFRDTIVTACDSFKVENPAPRPSVCKYVIGNSSLQPGNVVTYLVCISNYGGGALAGSLKDVLDPHLEFLSVDGYAYSGSSSGSCNASAAFTAGIPNNPSNNSPVIGPYSYNSATNTLDWNNVNLEPNCNLNNYSTLCIKVRAKVKDLTPTGTYPNQATLYPTGWAGTPPTASASITVTNYIALDASKYVKGDLDADYTATGSATPGSTVKFRIFLRNSGNVTLTNIKVADWLPHLGATYYMNPVPAASISAFYCNQPNVSGALPYTCSSPIPLTTFTKTFYNFTTASTLNDLDCLVRTVCAPTCTYTGSTTIPPSQVAAMDFTGLNLQPGEVLFIDISATLAATATVGTSICNSFAWQACYGNGAATPKQHAEVCLQIKPFIPNCCPKEAQTDVQLTSTSFSTTGVSTALQAIFNLTAGPYPIQEMRVSVTDLNLSYAPSAACVQCHTPYKYRGNFTAPLAQPNLVGLTGNIYLINKEIKYVGAPSLFSATPLKLNLVLPDLENIPCCEAKGEICLKFVFKDVNCNYCERVVCLPVSYNGQLPGPGSPQDPVSTQK